MGFFSYLFSINKRNADPVQQRLAQMIVDVAEGREQPVEIVRFIQSQGWEGSDQIERFTHALGMTRIFRGDLYPRAQVIFKEVCTSLQRLATPTEKTEMEHLGPKETEEAGEAVMAVLEKRARTIEGAIEILCITIMVLMKRLPSESKEQIRQAILNGIRNCS